MGFCFILVAIEIFHYFLRCIKLLIFIASANQCMVYGRLSQIDSNVILKIHTVIEFWKFEISIKIDSFQCYENRLHWKGLYTGTLLIYAIYMQITEQAVDNQWIALSWILGIMSPDTFGMAPPGILSKSVWLFSVYNRSYNLGRCNDIYRPVMLSLYRDWLDLVAII